MIRLNFLGLSCMLALAALTGPAFAQYMYLDANGDGAWTTDDKLNPDTTTVRLWLDINHDKDGSVRTCNDHTVASVGNVGVLTSTTAGSTALQSSDPTRFNGGLGAPVINVGVNVVGGGFATGTTVTANVSGSQLTVSGAGPTASGSFNITYNKPIVCQATVGSPNLTSAGLFGPVSVGMTISAGFPAGTTVIAVNSTSSVTMSANATAGTNVSRTFGAGAIRSDVIAGSTTITAGLFAQIFLGMTVAGTGTGAPGSGAASPFIVLTKTNESQLILSIPATVTGTNTLSYYDGLDLGGFDAILSATGGDVDFGTGFVPAPGFSNSGQPELAGPSTEATVHQLNNNYLYSQNGRFLLGYWLVTVVTGNPRIDIVDISTLDPASFFTGFSSHCDASSHPYTYTHRVDWFDTDGSQATDLPPEISAPTVVSGVEGSAVVIPVAASDPNQEPVLSLTVDLSGLPVSSSAVFTTSVDNAQGTLVWTPTTGDSGTYIITFTAANSLSASTSTETTVAAGSEAASVRSVRLQLPGPGYKVDAHFFDAFCTGGDCGILTYFSGDSGQVYVPLLACGPPCQWWDRVRIEFTAWTPAAYFDGGLASVLDLYPASNPADRPYNFTPIVDQWKIWTLGEARRIHDFYASMYGYAPGSVRIYYGPGINASLANGLSWKPSRSEVEGGFSAAEWILAHEYAHILGANLNGDDMSCCQSVSCVHRTCNQPMCPEGAWTEGFADGMADFYTGRVYPTHPAWLFLPSCSNPNPGIEYETNVGDFVLGMSERDPRGFMDTFRYATFILADPSIEYNAHNAIHYYDLWRDIDPEPFHILRHHPGTWNASAIWAKTIAHATTGVDGTGAFSDGIMSLGTNPVDRELDIKFSVKAGTTGAAEVFDISGRLVCSRMWAVSTSQVQSMKISVSGVASGLYFVRLRSSAGNVLGLPRKLLVVR